MPKDTRGKSEYEKGMSLEKLFLLYGIGVVTGKDKLSIDENKGKLSERIASFATGEENVVRQKYDLGKDSTTWKVQWAQKDVNENLDDSRIVKIAYRPFDSRYCYYLTKSSGLIVMTEQ